MPWLTHIDRGIRELQVGEGDLDDLPADPLIVLDDEATAVALKGFGRFLSRFSGRPVVLCEQPSDASSLLSRTSVAAIVLDMAIGADLSAGVTWLEAEIERSELSVPVYPFSQFFQNTRGNDGLSWKGGEEGDSYRGSLERLMDIDIVRMPTAKGMPYEFVADIILADLEMDGRDSIEYYVSGVGSDGNAISGVVPAWDPDVHVVVRMDGHELMIRDKSTLFSARRSSDGSSGFPTLVLSGRADLAAASVDDLRLVLDDVVGALLGDTQEA